MAQIPLQHIEDSHKLIADARIDLYELTPAGGTGTLLFKPDNDATWMTRFYRGLPMVLSGEKKTSDAGLVMPKMTIGQENIDLSEFKGLIYDETIDNAIIVRYTVLLDNLINNRNIREVQTYRVKRVEEYGRSRIVLQLATLSDALGFSMPFRQYLPPAFPSVQM